MTIRKHIPNIITILNLFSGSIGVYYAFQDNYLISLIAVLIAGLFDFLDGMAARTLKAYSPMGKELDSLADMVSFGLLPGAIAFSLLAQSIFPDWIKYAGFIITVFSALRLAKFNLDENQTHSFIGLPTPSNTIFWAGIGYAFAPQLIAKPWIIIVFVVLFSYLLVAKLPMFALKFSNLRWSENSLQYIFLIGCIILLILFQLNAFAPIIVWYVLASIYAYVKKIG